MSIPQRIEAALRYTELCMFMKYKPFADGISVGANLSEKEESVLSSATTLLNEYFNGECIEAANELKMMNQNLKKAEKEYDKIVCESVKHIAEADKHKAEAKKHEAEADWESENTRMMIAREERKLAKLSESA